MTEGSIGRQALLEIGLFFLDHSEDGYLVVDTIGTILYCNESFKEYFGLTDQELMGQNVRKLLHEVLIFDVMRSGQNSVETLGLLQRRNVRGPRGGADIHLISRYAVPDEQGHIVAGVLCIKYRDTLFAQAKKVYTAGKSDDLFQTDQNKKISEAPTEIVGRSPAFVLAKNMAVRSGRNDFPVLITGETGVGKEVMADLVHNTSRRGNKPFIKLNCAAIPSELLESELFGYEPGAFTGASRSGKKGKFELADGGSIFLDEIGDMPLNMQAKLLRVLQEKAVEHIGGGREIPVDVRIISATRKNLIELMRRRKFREDLYYRLNVINIQVPPLRERQDDILPLAEYFLHTLNSTYNTSVTLPEAAYSSLKRYQWPGNVRELNNVIQSAYALTDGETLNLDNFRISRFPENYQYISSNDSQSLAQMIEEFEKNILTNALMSDKLNLSAVAVRLGIPRSSLYNKLKRYGIDIRRLRFEDL